MMMTICRYSEDKKTAWDNLVNVSKNGTFLFLRAYMDYHSDRFTDHSLMFYDDRERLIAVLPANERDGSSLYSHQGLTYGGFILSPKVHTMELGTMFSLTIEYLRRAHITTWYYKAMPTIYHRQPAEDDEYWLWSNGAELIDCSLMTVIPLQGEQGIVSSSKRNNSNRLLKQGYTIDYNAPISDFWPILTQNLHDRFDARPVHTYDEIMLLQHRFANEIRCCTVKTPDGEVIAGTLLYDTGRVIKAQYTSASPRGKQLKALDYLILAVLRNCQQNTNARFFDFGTSMLADSTDLNEGLVMQKEGFGGRGIASKIYRISVDG